MQSVGLGRMWPSGHDRSARGRDAGVTQAPQLYSLRMQVQSGQPSSRSEPVSYLGRVLSRHL